MKRGEIIGGIAAVLIGGAILYFIAVAAFNWLDSTPAVKVPGQPGFTACSSTAYDPAGLAATCHP